MSENKTTMEPADIKLNSERDDIQQILGNPPGWALRWGITAVFLAVLIFLVIGWLIKYPDVVIAPVVIVTENPPIPVVARSSGKISLLAVADKETVREGQFIALLENTARLEDVLVLEETIGQLTRLVGSAGFIDAQLPEELQLGELQNIYADFRQRLQDLQFFERQQGVFARINSLEQQIRYLEELNLSLEERAEVLNREVALAEKDFGRNRELFNSGTVSEVTMEQSEAFYLQYQRQLKTLQSEVLNNHLLIEQHTASIIDLRQNRSDGSMEKWLGVQEVLENLKSELALWKQTYLMISPIAGQVSLTRFWSPQQFVQVNEVLATVVPEAGGTAIIGKALLPTMNSGKVRSGMQAQIRLDAYPYQEFGVLTGRVQDLALRPDEGSYLLDIALPDRLVTTYQETIPFSQEMPGMARIITEDRRVLERVFDRLLSLVKNS